MDAERTLKELTELQRNLLKRQQEIVDEKARLDKEASDNQRRILGIDQMLEGLGVLTGELSTSESDPRGLTDQIRSIINNSPTPLTHTQIRDALENAGANSTSSKNLLISVHTILGRIKSEFEEKQVNGKPAFCAKRTTIRRLRFQRQATNLATVNPDLSKFFGIDSSLLKK